MRTDLSSLPETHFSQNDIYHTNMFVQSRQLPQVLPGGVVAGIPGLVAHQAFRVPALPVMVGSHVGRRL